MTEAACPFCPVPSSRVFHEGRLVVGLWDAFPVSPGHALLVTRRHVPDRFEASPAERQELAEAVAAARDVIRRLYQPAGFNLGVNIGAAAGQTVFHLHVKLSPVTTGTYPTRAPGVRCRGAGSLVAV